jgi:hypothetical protein
MRRIQPRGPAGSTVEEHPSAAPSARTGPARWGTMPA